MKIDIEHFMGVKKDKFEVGDIVLFNENNFYLTKSFEEKDVVFIGINNDNFMYLENFYLKDVFLGREFDGMGILNTIYDSKKSLLII